MLTSIRNAAANWLGRAVLTIIMGILVVSFAIWGIGDIFRGSATRNVASIGKQDISTTQFTAVFNQEMRRLREQSRRAITNEQARAFGLDRAVLNRMLDEAALDNAASELGLALDPGFVAQSILNADIFKIDGVFSRARFDELMRQNETNESEFLRRQRAAMLRQSLLSGLVGGLQAPETLRRAEYQFRNEERNLEAILLSPDKIAEPATPDDAALRAYYTEHRGEFRTSETRKVTILATSPSQFAGDLTLSEADLRGFYERALQRGRFGTPEKRRILRVLFDSEQEAQEAADRVKAGTPFATILEERKLREADVDQGLKSRLEFPDPAIAEAAFALPAAGATFGPIKDAFGAVLLYLAAIEPAQVTPFEAVRGTIEGEARADKLANDPGIRAKLDAAFRAVEDQRLAGKSLLEAAQSSGLVAVQIPAIDRQGRDGEGNPLSIAGGRTTIEAIFASDIGLDNESLTLENGAHVWFEVNGVDPAREKTFEEVSAEVKQQYLADQRNKALSEFATGLVKRLDSGEALTVVAGELGVAVQTFAAIKRTSREVALGQSGIDRAFSGPIGKAVSAPAPDGASRWILVPRASSLLPFDAAADLRSNQAGRLAEGLASDVIAHYTADLRKKLGASINEAVLAQTLGLSN